MSEKRFELKLCSNGTYYVYENGTLTDIDFDKFNKESADGLIDELNALYDENKQLKSNNKEYIKGLNLTKATSQSWANDVRELREENCKLKKENDKIYKFIEDKMNEVEKDLKRAVKAGMSTATCYSDLDLLEEIKEILK